MGVTVGKDLCKEVDSSTLQTFYGRASWALGFLLSHSHLFYTTCEPDR